MTIFLTITLYDKKGREQFFSPYVKRSSALLIAGMNELRSRPDRRPLASVHLRPMRRLPIRLLATIFSILTTLIILLAFGSSVVLLIRDVPFFPFWNHLAHAPISAIPLLLIGVASLCFQIVIRPKFLDLFKAILVSAAFLLWGLVQLLPVGWLATILGDVVIVLYVLDLGWMMVDRLKQGWHSSPRQERRHLSLQSDECLHLLPSAPHIRTLPPLASSKRSTSQEEEPSNASTLPPGLINTSFTLKRYQLLPLRSTEQTRETDSL